MDRRILAVVLHVAHLFLAGTAISVVTGLALAALPAAIACPIPLLRQEEFLEQSNAKAALGHSAGARAGLDAILGISNETGQAETARARLGAGA